ncbi:hypothetical protein M8J77_016693 [Diaphorina citri]|nr:hypothetical protein M8J77_016693 [Diaphorina citri]
MVEIERPNSEKRIQEKSDSMRTSIESKLWVRSSKAITESAKELLGMTTGKGPSKLSKEKEAWWWNDVVCEAVKKKKEAKKKWDRSASEEDKRSNIAARKMAKRQVAKSRAAELDDVYKELERPGGERKLHRIAKSRNKASKDFTLIKNIKNAEGVVLRDEKEIKQRWENYFRSLRNEENEISVFEEGEPNLECTTEIEREEIVRAVSKRESNWAR